MVTGKWQVEGNQVRQDALGLSHICVSLRRWQWRQILDTHTHPLPTPIQCCMERYAYFLLYLMDSLVADDNDDDYAYAYDYNDDMLFLAIV